MTLPSILDWRTQTGIINKYVRKPRFFTSFFPEANRREHETRLIEMSYVDSTQVMAPFVKRGSEAFKISGYGHQTKWLEAPTAKIKFAINPVDYLTKQGPGETPVLQVGETMVSESVMRRVRRDAERIREYLDNQLEWMCAQALLGAGLTYTAGATGAAGSEASAELGDVFSVDYGRDASATIVLTNDGGTNTRWFSTTDGATNTTADPVETARAAKLAMSALVGVIPTLCIMGVNAGAAWQDLAKDDNRVHDALNTRRLDNAGPIPLGGLVDPDSGAVYEGTISQVDFWTMDHTVKIQRADGLYMVADDNGTFTGTTSDPTAAGTDIQLVHPNKAYFIYAGSFAERWIEYGPIEDLTAVRAGQMKQRFFTKTWEQQDPSVAWTMTETHPLPVTYRPDTVVEVTVGVADA